MLVNPNSSVGVLNELDQRRGEGGRTMDQSIPPFGDGENVTLMSTKEGARRLTILKVRLDPV